MHAYTSIQSMTIQCNLHANDDHDYLQGKLYTNNKQEETDPDKKYDSTQLISMLITSKMSFMLITRTKAQCIYVEVFKV